MNILHLPALNLNQSSANTSDAGAPCQPASSCSVIAAYIILPGQQLFITRVG